MNKIIISKQNYNKVMALQNKMPVKNDEKVGKTTAENIMSAKILLEEMAERIEAIQEAIYDFETAIFDKDVDEMVAKMSEYTNLMAEIKQNADQAEDYIAGSITTFAQTTAPSEFTVIVPEEEIKQAIESNFDTVHVMSLGFKDGEFALLFGEDEDTIDRPPFVFAKGEEHNYSEAQKFIEQFLDMEEDF
ncbi:MAG: hypothetical protein IIX54_03385 [Clostridia bacterium]|nr:hypothetical protein [Clostridia bacterium]